MLLSKQNFVGKHLSVDRVFSTVSVMCSNIGSHCYNIKDPQKTNIENAVSRVLHFYSEIIRRIWSWYSYPYFHLLPVYKPLMNLFPDKHPVPYFWDSINHIYEIILEYRCSLFPTHIKSKKKILKHLVNIVFTK